MPFPGEPAVAGGRSLGHCAGGAAPGRACLSGGGGGGQHRRGGRRGRAAGKEEEEQWTTDTETWLKTRCLAVNILSSTRAVCTV